MRQILKKVGRAWHFATTHLEGEHFKIPQMHNVPEMLQSMIDHVKQQGEVELHTYDIEGCFPNMPKEAINLALNEVVNQHKEKQHLGVWVPNNTQRKCGWKEEHKKGQMIPWDIMIYLMEFSLNNTFIKMPDGRIFKQTIGIPMGDPLSPGMTIGTCAWMEQQWKMELPEHQKKNFEAIRYMDDILLSISKNKEWDYDHFLKDFQKSNCYWKPLKLEEGKPNVFLETSFTYNHVEGLSYRIKNDNEKETNIWRYHHYNSSFDYRNKRRILLATLRKVHNMASDEVQLKISALCKLQEFIELGYPKGILKFMCAILARDTGRYTWRKIRDFL